VRAKGYMKKNTKTMWHVESLNEKQEKEAFTR
jgi:Uri superfamily endonuclease